MEVQTIAIITPVLTGIGLVIAGGIGWGKLSNRLNTLEENDKKLIAANGRPTYITRGEYGESQNKIVKEVTILTSKIEARDEKWDENWNTIAHHMGRVEEFMRQENKK